MSQIQEDIIQSIQLETTSRCNLNCVTCLKAEYDKAWRERDMSMQQFSHILSQIKDFKPQVHLQGWGEPLCHPQIFSFVKLLKSSGLTVSFTTNGTLINSSIAESLHESGLDGLTFSMAGICPQTQDPLRGAGTSDGVKSAVRMISAAKEKHGSPIPLLGVSYLLTPETVRELPVAVSWCRRNGVESFVSVHLTQAGGEKQQKLQYCKRGKPSGYDRLLRVKTHAASLFGRMKLQLRPFHPTLTPVCDKNPINSLFISAEGDVSPCVFLRPPVDQGINWRYRDRTRFQKPLVFGNVHDTPLSDIWLCAQYREFRDRFKKRADYHDRKLSRVSYSLSGSSELERAVGAIRSYFSSHPAPDQCAACAKLDGF